MKFRVFYLVFGLLVWFGCNDEDAITPSTELEPFLSLPQGNHDYDDRIMKLYEDLGVEIFYRFEPKDVYFNYTSGIWNDIEIDTTFNNPVEYPYLMIDRPYFMVDTNLQSVASQIAIFANGGNPNITSPTIVYPIGESLDQYGYPVIVEVEWVNDSVPYRAFVTTSTRTVKEDTFTIECADTNYVNEQLDLLENMFLDFYPVELLRETFLPRIMLGRDLTVVQSDGTLTKEGFHLGYNSMVFSYGDENILSMSNEEKRTAKTGLNQWFLSERAIDMIYEDVLNNSNWFELTDYAAMYSGSYYPTSNSGCIYLARVYGWISYFVDCESTSVWGSWDVETLMKNDLLSYLALIASCSYEELTKVQAADRLPGGGTMRWDPTSGIGRLSKAQNINGKTTEKYEALLEYLESKGINLAAAGEAFYESGN